MAASRSSRVTRSSVGLNGLDENFCGRTLRNRSIAQPEEGQSSPLPGSRAPRSPKKRQDGQLGGQVQQASEKPGGHPGKAAEHKASSTDGETWACPRSPRKRGLSCSDGAGGGSEKAENCEGRGKTGAGREASPLLKRAKRFSRSEESQVSEDEPPPAPPEPPSACSGGALLVTTKEISERADPLRQNSTAVSSSSFSPLSPNLNEEGGEKDDEDVVDRVQGDGQVEQTMNSNSHNPTAQSLNSNSHKSSNGLGQEAETDTLVLEPPASANTQCPGPVTALLNGNQTASPCPSTPDPIVPSRNFDPGQGEEQGMEQGEEQELECLAPPLVPFEEDSSTPHLSVREEEVEEEVLDVVGEEVCREEEVTATEEEEEEISGPGGNGQDSVATSINNIINSVNSLSGESPPPLAPPTPSNLASEPFSTPSPPSFTEPYEHRYTLRTSPRRATCGGGLAGAPSSPEPGSPPREVPLDNGPLREAGREALDSACRRLDLDAAPPAPTPSSGCDGPSSTLVTGPPPPSATTEHGNTGASGDMVGGRGLGDLPDTAVSKAGKEVLVGGSQLDDEDEEEEEPDVYYFESDHLTLKHNKDYQRLLQTIGVLEAQRIQAILDLEQLARQQREALQDPITFVEQLQKQVELGLPRPQRVVQLPGISWDQYTSGLGDFEREFCDKKRKTRRLKLIFDKVGLPAGPKSPVEPKKEGESSTLYSALPSSDAPENNSSSQMIRGRLCHQNKPDTFNQLWTVEEQKKLEQLLLKFPPEEVESKRWQKIADALGNRTAKQVASRVQKYFIKLTKAGIPVPGRTPNMCMYSKKVSNKKQHHLNKHLYRPSTFLTSYEPPVYMEEDERAAHYHTLQDPSGDDSDEEGVPLELRHLPEYKELLELKRMKKHKLQEIQSESSTTIHHGYKCDVCGVEPIQGVRWHCQDCPSDNAVDFCSNCSDCLFQTERHHPSHHLEPVYHHTFLDKDYCLAQTPGYNYLDPNYYPANR
ncbi:ZZ-type zinc finger-containing protein 3 isoform X2 [Esox lucius]|nr:ZZ-type zinc finger-containing protein 3 isoform X2 [Esox lucius]